MVAHKKWITLPSENKLDGAGSYSILDPTALYLGKSYSDYTNDWFNWFLSAHADTRNFGPAVFLRSHGIPPLSATGSYEGNESNGTDTYHSIEPEFPTTYLNDPNIRVGNNKLQIYDDQAVYVPIIVSYVIGVVPYKDWGNMLDYTGLTIDYGDNPPEPGELSINNVPIELPEGLPMSEFRIQTPIFMAVVPDAPYGTSLKDFLEEGQIPPGIYPAMVAGYFIMLRFKPGSYWVRAVAGAGREVRGPYYSELIYQIDVRAMPPCVPHGRISRYPAHNQGIVNRTLEKMREGGQLTEPEANRIKSLRDNPPQ